MILCFDIGGSLIKMASAETPEDLRLLGSVPTPGRDRDAFMQVLRDVIGDCATPPARISISMAGVADPDTGKARIANIPCLDGLPLQAELETALGLPVDLTNDADCFVLAEQALGAGRDHDVVFGVIIGTGVGGGLVVRGELINANGGFAGEWGHGPVAQRIVGDPPVSLPAFPCGCGLSGCLDAICSARGLEKLHGHLHSGEAADSRAIIDGWQAGGGRESRTVEIWLELMAGPLSMVQNLLGADIIAVGGGLSNAVPLIEALDRAVRARTLRRLDRPLVVRASCRIEPGLIGAAIIGLRNQARLAALPEKPGVT